VIQVTGLRKSQQSFSYGVLGQLLSRNNSQEAFTAFEQQIITIANKYKPARPAICDLCSSLNYISGDRFVCQTCADIDLRSPSNYREV
jgi:hypothetical protein